MEYPFHFPTGVGPGLGPGVIVYAHYLSFGNVLALSYSCVGILKWSIHSISPITVQKWTGLVSQFLMELVL